MHYSIFIQWSDEDQAYLVSLPEWAEHTNNPVTHGATYEEALRHGEEVLADLIAIWRERGWPLPEPHVYSHAGAS
jgi:predicted RNase H-like HicB family nuclease